MDREEIMSILFNIIGWFLLIIGLSMHKMRVAVAKEASEEVSKVTFTCYIVVALSVGMFVLGGIV